MHDITSALDTIQKFLNNEKSSISAEEVCKSLELVHLAVNEKVNKTKLTTRYQYFINYFNSLNLFTNYSQPGKSYSLPNSFFSTQQATSEINNNDEYENISKNNGNINNYTARSDTDLYEDLNYTAINNISKNYSDLGVSWDFDFLYQYDNVDVVKLMGPVVVFGFTLLKKTLSNFHPSCLQHLLPVLVDIQREYHQNHYHNSLHGAMVAHLAVILSREIGVEHLLSSYDHVAYVLAALAHDVGHPGRNNIFLANTANPLSLIYNDISTLENYHSSLLFHILRCHPDFVNQFGVKDWINMRKNIVKLILATDMRCHFNHVQEIKDKRLSGDFDLTNQEDMWQALVICIKAADIGHVAVSWKNHVQWTKLVAEEFYDQGDEEKRLGLPVSFLCDRDLSDQLPSTQINFLKCIALPLMEELQYLETEDKFISKTVIANLNDNLEKWNELSPKTESI